MQLIEKYLSWVFAVIVAAVSVSTYVFSNFESKEDAKQKQTMEEKRLDKIEQKIDRLIDMHLKSGG